MSLSEDEKIDESKLTVDNFQECAKTGGLLLPKVFSEKYAERIYNMEVYDDDIWIVTFPKCGTTWTQVRADRQNSICLSNQTYL